MSSRRLARLRPDRTAAADSYWFPDYLGDLDALLDALAPGQAVDLVGHSMGGNVVMIYAGVRPERVRRLVNLEGFGMPQTQPGRRPSATRNGSTNCRSPPSCARYDSVDAVAAAAAQDQPAAAAEQAPPGWRRTGRAGATTASGKSSPTRRTSAPTRCLPGRRGAGMLEADPRAAAVGRGRPHRHRELVGPRYTNKSSNPPGRGAAGRKTDPVAGRAHAAPRSARRVGAATAGILAAPMTPVSPTIFTARSDGASGSTKRMQ